MNETLKNIKAVLAAPPYHGVQRELARRIRIDISQLHRVLNDEDRLPSARVVARLAATLQKTQAQILISCYLREAAQEIATQVAAEQAEAAKLR